MTSRTDILPNSKGKRRLSYTCRAGWIDWGHGSAENAFNLRKNLLSQKSFPELPQWHNVQVAIDTGMGRVPAFIFRFQEEMGKFGIKIRDGYLWAVQKGLSKTQLEQVAFRIFMETSMKFEQLQGSFPYSIFSGNSSFSGEDLVSNLVGFYRAFRLNHSGNTDSTPVRRWLGEVSVEECLRIWDECLPKNGGLGALKNPSTTPLKFKSNECRGGCSFPTELSSIRPAPASSPWFVRLNALQYANAQHQMRRDAVNVVDMHGRIKVLDAATQ
jgi:hypothetical protein